MSKIIRILIVEDQVVEQENWQQMIDLQNADIADIRFDIEFAASLVEAESRLYQRQYDAAIVDIRLEQEGVSGANADGNAVIARVCQSGLMVVAAFTGEGALVESKTIKTFTKGSADDGDGTEAVLSWLVDQIPLILAVRSAHALVQHHLAQLFHSSVWPRWRRWVERRTEDSVELPLARHLTSHVHAALLEEQGHRVHPEEWYFIPPIRAGIRTGDIVRLNKTDFEIVVSPRCDLSPHSKVTHILLAKCTCVANAWNTLENDVRIKKLTFDEANDDSRASAEKKLKAAQNEIRKFTQHNNNTNSVHFLPRVWLQDETEFGPVFVNFDQLRSVEKDSEDSKVLISQRVAAVAPEFLPSLVERLGSYLSRIGTPDYSHPDE